MTRLIDLDEIFQSSSRVSAVVATAMCLMSRADALTCAYNPMSLEESYALAEAIVVAQVLGCTDGGVPEGARCPDSRYHIETIEELKEPEPWQNFSGAYQGADGVTRCGQAFTLGGSYLLFFDGSGSIISSAGGALKGPYPETRELQGKLAILREYLDGEVADLSDPWIFTDIGLSCELKQRVAGHEIAFRYPYAESWSEYSYGIEYDNDGNPTLLNPTLVSQAFGPGMTYEIDGPNFVPQSLHFSVQLLNYLETERDTATITIGERTWHLETQIFRLLGDGREISSQSIDLVLGESAHQIFDSMLNPTTVTVSKHGLEPSAAAVARTPIALDTFHDVEFETRTARFAAAAKEFQECIDGTD